MEEVNNNSLKSTLFASNSSEDLSQVTTNTRYQSLTKGEPDQGSCCNARVAKIAFGLFLLIAGAIAAGVAFSYVGYPSLACLGASAIGVLLLALTLCHKKQCCQGARSPITLHPDQARVFLQQN